MLDKVELKAKSKNLAESVANALTFKVSSDTIKKTMNTFYSRGLEEMELRFNMNFTRDNDRLSILNNFVMENIKGLNAEMQDKIRKEITQGLMNLEGIGKIQKRIRDVVEMTRVRATLIARTEANRALNMAHTDAARQSGLKLEKEWVSAVDDRTSPICTHLNGKRIPMNKKFKYNDKEFDAPPAHINCRSRLIFVQV